MGERSSLLLDTCIIITFGNAKRLDLITGIGAWQPVTSRRVLAELTTPPAEDPLPLIDSGVIGTMSLDVEAEAQQDALAHYDRLPAFRGRADAELLAIWSTLEYE